MSPPAPAPATARPFLPLYQAAQPHAQVAVCAACAVRSMALFGALDHAGLERIHTHIADVDLPPGRTLLPSGVRGTAVYTVRRGVMRFERVNERGDRRIVRLAGRGALIGQEALVRRGYADEGIACTAVQLCRIPVTLVQDLTRTESALVQELLQRWQQALEEAQAWLADLATGPARRRMLRLLIRLVELAEPGDGPQAIWLPPRDQMGAMLGMTVETCSRLVSALRREQVLRLEGAAGAMVDAAALQCAARAADDD